jgi:hypothetical protein
MNAAVEVDIGVEFQAWHLLARLSELQQNKAAKTNSNIYKLQHINRVTKCLVQLIYKIQFFIMQFLSLDTEAVHSVIREQKKRMFKYFFYKETNE